MSRTGPVWDSGRALGWTLAQGLLFVALHDQATDLHPSHRDLTREALTARFGWTFVALALAANLLLGTTRLGARWPLRAGVWLFALGVLAAISWPEAAAYPLYVPFLNGAALAVIVAREGYAAYRRSGHPRDAA